jgi:hypothetical protein
MPIIQNIITPADILRNRQNKKEDKKVDKFKQQI